MDTANENTIGARILIVDDNPTMRDAITLIVDHESDLTVCGDAKNVDEAISLCETLKPDLALIDVSLKGENGFDLVRRMKECAPDVRTVVFSLHDESSYIDGAREAGAGGYAIKSGGPRHMLTCMRTVLDGQSGFTNPAPE